MTITLPTGLEHARLEHYDVRELILEALAMPQVCSRNSCVAPTVHLLAVLLAEATGNDLRSHEPPRNKPGDETTDQARD